MTRIEHLLTILAEECNEVAQRTSKALRFGLSEIQPGQPYTNQDRIWQELTDLYAVVSMITVALDAQYVTNPYDIKAKIERIEKFLAYSKQLGTLT